MTEMNKFLDAEIVLFRNKATTVGLNRALKKECTPSDFVARNANFSGWNPHSA
jgi:hypothetical protein